MLENSYHKKMLEEEKFIMRVKMLAISCFSMENSSNVNFQFSVLHTHTHTHTHLHASNLLNKVTVNIPYEKQTDSSP